MRVYKLEIAGASLCGFINGPGEPWELWDTVAHRWAGFASEGLDWMTPCSRVEAEAIRRQRAVK